MEVTVKLLLFIVIAGALLYLLLKFCLYLYRPFFLSKTYRKIDQMYNRLLTNAEKNIEEWIEGMEAWRSNEVAARLTYRSEDEIIEEINNAKEDKAHEEKVYGKFLRCRERFVNNPSKLSGSIVAYQRYLDARLKLIEYPEIFVMAGPSRAMNFDEMMAVKKEAMIVLEENERKLDVLQT